MREAGRKSSGTDADAALIRRIAERDRDALGELYHAYHARLFKFVYRLTASYASADELVNDIMFVVWQKADSFRGDSKPSTWIFGIAYRLAMKCMSRRKPDRASGDTPDELPAPDAANIEAENWVQSGIERLPDVQRATVFLVFYLGLSYEETAAVTGCPVNTVKTRMFHARRKLRELLEATAEPTPRVR